MADFKKLTDEELKNVTGAGENAGENIGAFPPNVNWPNFGACLIENNASAIPALSEIVSAIRDENWTLVQKLATKPEIIALPIVAYCVMR